MKPIPLVRTSVITPPILFLKKAGAPVHRYLQQANIPEQALEHPEVPIPLAAGMNFYHLAARAEGLDSLGLAFTDSYHIFELGLFGQLIRQALTLYDALIQFCDLIKNTCTGQPYWLQEEIEQVWFCTRYDEQFYRASFFHNGVHGASHYAFVMVLDLMRQFLGVDWQPPEVYMSTPPFKDFVQRCRLEQSRIHYGHSHVAICVPRQVIASSMLPVAPSPSLDPQVNDWQENAPKQDFVGTLEQTLTTLLLDGYPTIEVTADVVGISIRTLQRNLSKQGLTYSQLMDKVRYQKSLALLQHSDIPLIGIAYALGFSDPANFSHAFKRWTGLSPQQFCRSQIC
jgi:AraC-like DNA-binding protein